MHFKDQPIPLKIFHRTLELEENLVISNLTNEESLV